jgi:hypothetical protein
MVDEAGIIFMELEREKDRTQILLRSLDTRDAMVAIQQEIIGAQDAIIQVHGKEVSYYKSELTKSNKRWKRERFLRYATSIGAGAVILFLL